MSAKTPDREWFEQMMQYRAAALPDSELSWLQKIREEAAMAIMQIPLPERRQEQWRYSAVDNLLRTRFIPAEDEFAALQEEDVEQWLLEDTTAYRVVFANGQFMPTLRNFSVLPEGVVIGSLRQALTLHPDILTIWFGQTVNHTEDIFTALNTALGNDGLLVYLKSNVVLERPIEVLYLNLEINEPQLIQPRNLIVLEQGASARLLERYYSVGESVYFYNGVSEILLEQDAALRHFCMQEQSVQAFHLQRDYLAQATHSQYQRTAVAIGSRWARNDLQVRFLAEQAQCDTRGLYLVGDGQLIDQHLNVLHTSPANRSAHHYKGILYGKGHGVFDGRILVGKEAQRTDARLVNNNLMLYREAEIDTKPQLEIFADNVVCSHGTTVTQPDPEQIFYLRSRGIDAATALRLVSMGFAAEIVEQIDYPEIRAYLEARLGRLLQTTAADATETSHA